MLFGLPPWPFWGGGSGTFAPPSSDSLYPWAKPAGPPAWHGFPHIWDSNVLSTGSVGIDYTLKVTPLETWYVHSDNDLRISSTTLEADP